MPKFDVTKLNVAIDRLLEVTTNPRHQFILQAYSRHRYLEVAGRYVARTMSRVCIKCGPKPIRAYSL